MIGILLTGLSFAPSSFLFFEETKPALLPFCSKLCVSIFSPAATFNVNSYAFLSLRPEKSDATNLYLEFLF